jgi:hypothetical protein
MIHVHVAAARNTRNVACTEERKLQTEKKPCPEFAGTTNPVDLDDL